MYINLIRDFLAKSGLECFIVSSSDRFLNEYVKDSLLTTISGFTGSNGTVLIFNTRCVLFTDGRYLLQGAKECENYEVLNEAKTGVIDFLKLNSVRQICCVYDYFSQCRIENFENIFEVRKISSNEVYNILGITQDVKVSECYDYDIKFAGRASKDKKSEISEQIETEAILIGDSASVCWLANIRGNDVPNTPICNCFAILYKYCSNIDIFGNFNKYYSCDEYSLLPEKAIKNKLSNISSITLDKSEINGELYDLIKNSGVKIVCSNNVINNLKSIKNEIEIRGFKNAHELDGIAVEALIDWVKNNIGKINEHDIVVKSNELRCKSGDFISLSFDTIAGFNSNGAIIHYKPGISSAKLIEGDGILLIDSGGQYKFGTTDVTRTIAIGDPLKVFPSIKKHYTLVYKALHYLQDMKFPKGTSGIQLDAIARSILWREGLDYPHGTGHGVGHFSSVHEGSAGISRRCLHEIKSGMILSIEPGIYIENMYGIRLENLVLVKDSSEFQDFLEFETLTNVRFEDELIEEREV